MSRLVYPSAHRILRRHRRWLSAAAAGVSVLALGMALRPSEPATSEAVVAARDLFAGSRLELTDLAAAPVPEALLPPGVVTDPGSLVGQVLAAPVAAGEPITTTRVTEPLGVGWSTAPGTTPLPVRFADGGAAELLSAGQHLDVLAATAAGVDDLGPAPGQARLIAQDVLVLAVTGSREDESLLSAGSGGERRSPVVVLAATREQALAIAGAEAASRLSFLIAPGPGG